MRVESKGLAEAIERMKARGDRVRDLSPALEFYGEDIVTRTDTQWNTSKNWDGSPFADLADSTLEQKAAKFAGGKGGLRKQRSALRTKLKAAGKSDRQVSTALKRQMQGYHYKRVTFGAGLSKSERSAALASAQKSYTKRNEKIRASDDSRTDKARKLRLSRSKYKAQRSRTRSNVSSYKILIDTARARNSNHVDPPQRVSLTWSAVGYLGFHMTGTARMPVRNPTPFVWKSGKWQLADDAQEDFTQTVVNYVYRGDPEQGAR